MFYILPTMKSIPLLEEINIWKAATVLLAAFLLGGALAYVAAAYIFPSVGITIPFLARLGTGIVGIIAGVLLMVIIVALPIIFFIFMSMLLGYGFGYGISGTPIGKAIIYRSRQ